MSTPGRRASLVHQLFERILLARVERLNILVVETLFVNFDARAKQQRLRKLLDRKTDSIGCRFEAAIAWMPKAPKKSINVRLWHLADIWWRSINVRFRG